MALKKYLQRLTTSAAEQDQDDLREFCSLMPGTTPVAEVVARDEVTVVGEIRNVRIVPRPDGTSWLEATVSDGTGSIVAMWVGRTSIAGVQPGKRLMLSGRSSPSGSGRRLRLTNPLYELL